MYCLVYSPPPNVFSGDDLEPHQETETYPHVLSGVFGQCNKTPVWGGANWVIYQVLYTYRLCIVVLTIRNIIDRYYDYDVFHSSAFILHNYSKVINKGYVCLGLKYGKEPVTRIGRFECAQQMGAPIFLSFFL